MFFLRWAIYLKIFSRICALHHVVQGPLVVLSLCVYVLYCSALLVIEGLPVDVSSLSVSLVCCGKFLSKFFYLQRLSYFSLCFVVFS